MNKINNNFGYNIRLARWRPKASQGFPMLTCQGFLCNNKQGCELKRLSFQFKSKFEFSIFWHVGVPVRVLYFNFFEFKFGKNIKFFEFEFRQAKILRLLFDLIPLFFVDIRHKQVNDYLNLHRKINKKYYCPTIFYSLNFILMNSNTFYWVRVQKNFFFLLQVCSPDNN